MHEKHDDDKVQFTPRDIAFAAALAAKSTIVEAAENAGRKERWGYNELQRSPEKIARLKEILEPYCKVNRRQIKQMAAHQADEAIEALLGTAIGVIQEALEEGDLKTALDAANDVINRVKGKPTSTVNVNQSGRIDHVHKHYVTPVATLEEFDRDVLADASLYDRARKITRGDRAGAVDIART